MAVLVVLSEARVESAVLLVRRSNVRTWSGTMWYLSISTSLDLGSADRVPERSWKAEFRGAKMVMLELSATEGTRSAAYRAERNATRSL